MTTKISRLLEDADIAVSDEAKASKDGYSALADAHKILVDAMKKAKVPATHTALEMSKAFADAGFDIPNDIAHEIRNLKWKSKDGVDGKTLIDLFSKICPAYNDFNTDRVKTLVAEFDKRFPQDNSIYGRYFPAREGSVCIYVDCRLHKTLPEKEIDKIRDAIHADEGDKEGPFQYRFWWD